MTKANNAKPCQVLNKAFLLKKQKNPAYSQRALARDLSVSPVFVTKILTGQKSLPPERFKKAFQVLDMDITLQSAFMKAVILEALPQGELRELATTALIKDSKFENYARESSSKFGILKQWYNTAILSYLTCEDLDSSPAEISKYFNISETEVSAALKEMEKLQLVENKNGAWLKLENHSYFPTTKSMEDVRHYHKQMLQKAYKELSKTQEQDFDKRLITGFSVAVNPNNVEKAKKMIAEFMGHLSYELAEGDCQEVYQCNVQMFPLKKSGDSK